MNFKSRSLYTTGGVGKSKCEECKHYNSSICQTCRCWDKWSEAEAASSKQTDENQARSEVLPPSADKGE